MVTRPVTHSGTRAPQIGAAILDAMLRYRDPQGVYFGGNEMHLRPRELYAFAELTTPLGDLARAAAAHLLATLAAHGPAEEWQLWHIVRGVLQDAAVLREGQGPRCVEELLTRPELPAKANWVSCLRGSSERPSYVTIANPLAEDESCP